MMDTLSPAVDRLILTDAPSAPRTRAWSLADALAYASARGHRAVAIEDFDEALHRAESEGATVLVTGSFHTVGDAMARLQVSPLTG